MLASSRAIREAVELAMPGAYVQLFHEEMFVVPLESQRDDEHLHALDEALAKLNIHPSSQVREDYPRLWYD